MDGILQDLDYFANISGLRFNFSKTKMIWIGSKKFSNEVFHHSRWKLDWKNNTFDMLGIKFSVNLPDMVELNYLPKLIEIRKLLKQWKVRRMTPIGRLTVLKTLIIPKLNHLILALPMPNDNFLKDLESEMFEFLWNNKIHKVKKHTVIQDYRHGG